MSSETISSPKLRHKPVEPNSNGWFRWLRPTDGATSAALAEHKLLSRIPFFRSLHGPNAGYSENSEDLQREKLCARVGLVDLDGDGKRAINTLIIDREDETLSRTPGGIEFDKNVEEIGRHGRNKQTLVMCHGYGAGLGFFYRNYSEISQVPNWKIYALDWLGMANSSRPVFDLGRDEEKVEAAENFFLESLEKWRMVNNLEKMVLLGHSLGGYLSAVYAMRYPERVEKLILVSPVGVPIEPEERRKLPLWATKMWESNLTPMSILRFFGRPLGPSLVNFYVSRRFPYFSKQDMIDFKDYIFHTASLKGSGEYALSALLKPGAWAKSPLSERAAMIKCPVTFVYGDVDWMNYEHSLQMASKISNLHKVECKVLVIKDSGHHLYLDNPAGFNEAIMNEMGHKTPQNGAPSDVVCVFRHNGQADNSTGE